MDAGEPNLNADGYLEDCARQMDSLADELRSGMAAIRANSPERLASSVSRQRLLAEALTSSSVRAASAAPTAATWPARARKAAHSLRALNQEYAALIEHSGRSVRLLAQLHNLQTGAPRIPDRSWSVSA